MTQSSLETRTEDPIKEKLESLGIELAPYRLSKSSQQIGWTFSVNAADFAYRWADDGEVTIIEYRNDTPRKGMRNAFVEFLWFVDFLCDPVFELDTISGNIRPLDREDDMPEGLGRERIVKYYKILGGQVDGLEWTSTKMSVNVPYYRNRYAQRIPPTGLPV